MDTPQGSQRLEGLLLLLAHQEEPGRFGVEDHTDAEDESWQDLHCEGEPPRGLALAGAAVGADILGRVESRLLRCATGVKDIWRAPRTTDILGAVLQPVANEDTKCDIYLDGSQPVSFLSSERTKMKIEPTLLEHHKRPTNLGS